MSAIFENQKLVVAICVFLVCILLGYIGDKRLKDKKTIEKFKKEDEIDALIKEEKEQKDLSDGEKEIIDNKIQNDMQINNNVENVIEDEINNIF